MATVGDQLLTPEAGWKRCDDTDQNITYSSKWTNYSYGSGDSYFYNNSIHQSRSQGDIASFKFTGTKLRLLSYCDTYNSSTADVYIDEAFYSTISFYGPSTIVSDNRIHLVLDVNNLESKEHSFKLIVKDTAQNAYSYVGIDAIDIDENGELKPYNPTPSGSDQAILRVTMIDSSEREYKLPKAEIDGFISWFTRTIGTGTTVYVLNKMTGSKDYLAFDKIISFEVIPVA